MKICTQCQTEKEDNNFYKQQQKGKNGQTWYYLDSMCKPCRSSYTSTRRRTCKMQIIEYLGGECKGCKTVGHPSIYDCHHLDPSQKDFSPSKQNRKFETIKDELDKCVLLCANCHRRVHAGDLIL